MSIFMTGSYFHKKIILIVALVAFLIGGVFPVSSVEAARETSEVGQPASQGAQEGLKGVAGPESENDEISCGLGWVTGGGTISGCFAKISFLILQVASWVLWVAAILFNATINYSLNMANFIKDIPIVDVGWTIFRDVTNLLFIFIILYIAINTIIGNEGYGIKKLLGKVIVGAMLINFSLFFTQAMIDASNIFALQFYHKIVTDAKGANVTAGKSANNSDYDSGISAAFVNAMGLQQIYMTGKGTTGGDGISSDAESGNLSETKLGLNAGNLILVGLGGTVLVLITAFVFFAGAFMLLARTVVLIFLMILSPIAFMGNILPALGKHTGKWWSKLTDNLLFAPVYMMLLYLVINMVTGSTFKKLGGGNGTFADMFAGGQNWIPTIITFVVLIMMMIGCLMIASTLGMYGGKWAESFGKDMARNLGMGFGAGGVLARNTIGRGAEALAKSELARTYAPDKMLRGINSLADKKFGGRISFVDRRKEKTDLAMKALEMRTDVGVRRAGESKDEFDNRKEAARTMAAARLGLTHDGQNFIVNPNDKSRKAGQIFGKGKRALAQAAWIKKSGKSTKDNLDEQIKALESQKEDFDAINQSTNKSEVDTAKDKLAELKDVNHAGSIHAAERAVKNINPSDPDATIKLMQAMHIETQRRNTAQQLQQFISKSSDITQKLAATNARKAELDSK